MLEINIGAAVKSQEREIGRVERIVLNRDSYEATHLVVKQGGFLHPARHALMPIDWVVGSGHDYVLIDRSEEEVAELPNFEMQHYVRLDQLDDERAQHPRSAIKPSDWINYVVPFVASAFGEPYRPPGVVVTDQLLSPSESAVSRGLQVESSDGHKVGEIHEVLLSAPDWRLSGIIITRGFVLKRPMRLPADWVAKIGRDRITLNRSRRQIEAWERQQD
ncbi:MAG TPA: PRC-barrel domain-containing protein [Blastocatellia bacterium]